MTDDHGNVENVEKGDQKLEKVKEWKGNNENEEKTEVMSMRRENTRPQRTAACNARAKTALMLDP